jgi:outer membrane receptor protein involved in Fe transport
MRFPYVVILSACVLMLALPLLAQSPNGVLNGQVVDPANRVIVGAEIVAMSDVTHVQYTTKTNDEGIYVLPNLPPGPYRLQVSKFGFKTLIKPDITLNVQDALAINFTLPVGSFSEVVTVESGAPLVNTESAAISTVVDRNFAENLPLNGRSFQTLIQLTPGVVLTTSSASSGGQFSVNGQRASSNYWMVDGVSANVGISSNAVVGNGFGGSLGSFSVLGGTNSLVSVDALEEFRILTSSYAPEFGRAPGGQISILTRSGTNLFHGTLFDYFRNDILDANNWFAARADLSKPQERQNDFGGTIGGPLRKDHTFFFFSYEGLRLRLPQTALTTVPDVAARESASPDLKPYLNAFPLPNGTDDIATGVAQFNSSYSNASTLDAYSLRIDQRLTNNLNLFGRYNYSPSELVSRGLTNLLSLSVLRPSRITTQTLTLGSSWLISTALSNDLRFNYSRTTASSHFTLDDFGGAVPLSSLSLPSPYNDQNSSFVFRVFSLASGTLEQGALADNRQRQFNLVEGLAWQKRQHSLKIGGDYRRLTPFFGAIQYSQQAYFSTVPSAAAGNLFFSFLLAGQTTTQVLNNLGIFAQDSWRVAPRLTLTYGARWELDVAPSASTGPSLNAVTGFSVNDLSSLALAPPGTRSFSTGYGNVAPRFGLAYQLQQNEKWQSVARGGVGIFYDLVTSEVGNAISTSAYPFGASKLTFGGTFPLSDTSAAPPPIVAPGGGSGKIYAFDPHVKLPYSVQWTSSMEQALGKTQSLSLSYIGSLGRRLLQTALISSPNPNYGSAQLITNTSTSNYNALQIQFERRLSRGLQALSSYTWSHSIDDGSTGSVGFGAGSDAFISKLGARANRGPSDFDIRHSASAGLTYQVRNLGHGVASAIVGGWSIQNLIQAHSSVPVNIYYSAVQQINNSQTSVRPDRVSDEALYLRGDQYPGGKAFNPDAFTQPPTDPDTQQPTRQGNLERNGLRGFDAIQWDLSIHREIPICSSWKLQFRAEMFNVLNHPNFGAPNSAIDLPDFGVSTQLLADSLNNGNLAAGGFNPLYQVGGPRSIQLALKLTF